MYSRVEVADGRTVMNAELYNKLQDGIVDAETMALGFQDKVTTEENGVITETFKDGSKIVTEEESDTVTIQTYYDGSGNPLLKKTITETDNGIVETVQQI